jgi:hypothetical protein
MRAAPLLLLLALVAPSAGAQAPATCQLAEPALDHAAQDLPPAGTATYILTLTNQGTLAGTATVTVASPPPGWTATVAPESADIAGGGTAQQAFTVSLTAPASNGSAGSTMQTVTLSATASLDCNPTLPVGGAIPPDTKSTQFTATVRSGAAAPGPGGVVGGAAPGALVLVGAVGLVAAGAALALRGQRAGLVLRSDEARRDIPPGGGASFAVRVENRAREARTTRLRVGEVPPGWRVVLPPGDIALGPGESRTVQVLVRPPGEAKAPAAADLPLEADVPRGKPAKLRLQAFVVEPGKAGPSEPPAARPDVVVRDEGEMRRGRARRR